MITCVNEYKKVFPLSYMQEIIMLHKLLYPNSKQYYEQISYRIEGLINDELFYNAWQAVSKRNEMLRVCFSNKKEIKQFIKEKEIKVEIYDLSCLTEEKAFTTIENMSELTLYLDINLEEDPFIVCLYHLSKNSSIMTISNHHILYDGWSNMILLNDWKVEYKNQVEKRSVGYVKKPYYLYAEHCKNSYTTHETEFWEKYFEGYKPLEYSHREVDSEWQLEYCLPSSFNQPIKQFVSNANITLATLIYFTWSILLSKLNDTNDVLFGISMTNRPAEMDDVVGLFITTLPLRVKLDNKNTLLQQVQDIRNRVLELIECRFAQTENYSRFVDLKKNTKLYDSIVVMQNYPIYELEMKNDKMLQIKYHSKKYKVGMGLSLGVRVQENIIFDFTFDQRRFCKEEAYTIISCFADIFINLLNDNIDLEHTTMQEYLKKISINVKIGDRQENEVF